MFDYRILQNNKSKHKAVDKIIMFQYYMDVIIQAIKDNDLTTLNDYRLSKLYFKRKSDAVNLLRHHLTSRMQLGI